MQILIAGASGFIGKNLVKALLSKNYRVSVLGRERSKLIRLFSNTVQSYSWDDLDQISASDFSAVINLAGENIGETKWSSDQKANILKSRVHSTEQLINWIKKSKAHKPHLYNASAIGIYPANQTAKLTEDIMISPVAKNFLQAVGIAWEKAADQAKAYDIPLTLMRFAVVLQKGEGILKKMYPSFYLGLGATFGKGDQAFSWIAIEDLIAAIIYLINNPSLTGIFNLCSPNPITHLQFCQCLAKTLHRPLLLQLPKSVVSILFGQMGQELLLEGHNVYPTKLLNSGFTFSYPNIEAALYHQFNQ